MKDIQQSRVNKNLDLIKSRKIGMINERNITHDNLKKIDNSATLHLVSKTRINNTWTPVGLQNIIIIFQQLVIVCYLFSKKLKFVTDTVHYR